VSGEFTVDAGAMDSIAGALEGMSAFIESAPSPDLSADVAAAMPNSPLVAATADATKMVKQSKTTVSGQWETFASAVRAARTIAESADEGNATKFQNLSTLPGIEFPQ
jgi:hypothetical protein